MRRMFLDRNNRVNSRGFTLVEILIILPPVLLITMVAVSVLFSLVLSNSQSQFEVAGANSVKTSLNIIEQDMKTGAALLTTQDSQMTDAYIADSGGANWSYNGTSAQSRALIIRGYATTDSPSSTTKNPVYINQFGCDAANLYSNPVLTTNIIYFVKNNSLYRRVLIDNTKTLCPGVTPYQRQSCPPGLASPDPSCKASDSLLLKDVATFTVQYYTNGTLINNPYGSSDPQVLSQATTAEPSVTVSKQVAGNTVAYTDTVKVNKNNSQPYNAPPPTSATNAPGKVTGLVATKGSGQVALSWSAVSGATSYQVERATTPYFTSVTQKYSGTAANYTDTSVVQWTIYYYRARALTNGVPGLWSTYVQGSALGYSRISWYDLTTGQFLNSPNGNYTAIMQTDGNFVLYNASNIPLWATGTSGSNNTLSMQPDGNIVVYHAGSAIWASGTTTYGWNRCYWLELYNTGSLVLNSYAQSSCNNFLGSLWQRP